MYLRRCPLASLLRSIALLFYLGPLAINAGAQNFSVQHWTTRNGLRTSAVDSITQTVDGNLWIGTRAGLARFDGSQFKVFTPRNLPELSSKFIDYITTGPDSTLYVGTDDRLCVLRHGHWQTFAIRRGERSSKVLTILPAGNDEAWIGTLYGWLFHYKDGSISEVGLHLPSEGPIYGLAKTRDETLWIATELGLFSMSQTKIARYQPATPFPVQAFYDLTVTPDGTLFAASDAGLFGIRGSQWKQWDKTSGLPGNQVNVLSTDPQGVLWIGTRSGLARLEGSTVRPVNSVGCQVHALFVDADKSLWIGCDDRVGLFRLTTYNFRFLAPSQPFDLASASLAADSKGAVWIGSRQGLYKYANGHFQSYTQQDGLPSNRVRDVSVTGNDVVWIATEDGLAKMDNGKITPVDTKQEGFSGSFSSVLEGVDGTLWAVSDQGLGRRLPGQTAMSLEQGFPNLLESMYQDRSGALWVSTELRGLFRFTGGTRTTFLKTCGLGSDTVYGSVQDDSGTIWAWTFGGLSRIRGTACANIAPDAGLPSGGPGSIAYDGAGHLWLRTQDGVAAVDIAEANTVIDHLQPLQKTRFFGSEQGLDTALNDLETLNFLVVRATGQIWIPTTAGIAVLDASSVQRSATQMRPQVTSFVSDSGEHDVTAPVQLDPGDLHLQFRYRVPSLLGTSGRLYRYRLFGFDKSWREGQESRDAIYTSIPAGTYKFEVSSRQPFEPWSAASDPVEFTLFPHFYQTWWWYTLLGLTAAAVLWLGFWFRLLAVRKQYAAVYAERAGERSRLARELHDTLSRGMMAIQMQLQLARAFLPAKPTTACTHLDAAIGIVRESASETRRSIAALRSTEEEVRSLQDLLARTAADFKANSAIPLEVDIDSALVSLEADVKHEIARIVDEALRNVLQHSDARQARLSASIFGHLLRIEIIDDGLGFSLTESQQTDSGRFGIQGMRERAQRIQANLTTSCVAGEGTTVVLDVPLKSPKRRWKKLLSLTRRAKRN